MAGLLNNAFTTRAGTQFKVNDQGYRINEDGTLFQYTPGATPTTDESINRVPEGMRTQRIDPATGRVYYGGIEGARLENGVVTQGLKTPEAQQWTPTTREVQPKDTVAEQMRALLAENSPYIQEAEKGALRTANSRGLLNSSIAAGAGRGAAIAAAMPIATQDASTYFAQGTANQNAVNAAGQFNTAEANDLGKMTLGQRQDLEKLARAQGYNLETLNQQQINDLAKQLEVHKQDLEKLARAQGYNLETLNQQQINDLEKQLAAHRQDVEKLGLAGEQETAKITLQGDIQKQLVALDQAFKTSMVEGDDLRLRTLEAAKNAAALNAQFIQAAGEINKADMSTEDKKSQLEALRSNTNDAVRDAYRMFLPDASEEEVNAAVDGATASLTSLEEVSARLDKIEEDLNKPADEAVPTWNWDNG